MVLSPRLKILGQLEARPHRYRRWRLGAQLFTLAALFAVPLTGVARFDLWAGHHRSLFAPTDPVTGFFTVLFAIPAFYFPTFFVNFFLGRLFCGFGCPVGQVSRFADGAQAATGRGRGLAQARAWGYAALLAFAVLLWWVDPAVCRDGSARARTLAAGGFLGLTALLWLHGRLWRWSFCESYCPIGLYYSVIHLRPRFGIHFDDPGDRCRDCDACAEVCPVGLDPRDLSVPRSGLGGLALSGFPSAHHCLVCGDCVRACELVLAKQGVRPPLLLGRGARSPALGPVRPRGPSTSRA
jgi:polyferredoxin